LFIQNNGEKMDKLKSIASLVVVSGLILFSANSYSESEPKGASVNVVKNNVYKIKPGDIIDINVWKEEGMVQEVLVRPDGGISFPLVGDVTVQKMSLVEVELLIKQKLSKYLSDPVVTVSAKQLLGNKIYVIGQINKPGEYVVNREVDVMQVLSMAGGMTPFAAVNDIIILRRDIAGKQRSIKFEYGEIEDGDGLEQNIVMQAGDVVVVP